MRILKIPFRLSDFRTPIGVVGSDSRVFTLKSDRVCKAFLNDKEINIKVGDTLILVKVKDLWIFKLKVGWFTFEFKNIRDVIEEVNNTRGVVMATDFGDIHPPL